MPKNPPKNAFYFFMIDFKEEQRKKGFNYSSLQEAATAAGPVWKEVSEAVRQKYTEKAKAEKEKRTGHMKFTSTGIPLAVIEQIEQEKKNAEATERQEIINFVKLKGLTNSLLDEDIFIMDVNSYCKVNGVYLIGEMTLLKFSLREGVKEKYHVNINPGYIPMGYAYDVKLGCQDYGLEMPDTFDNKTDFIHVLTIIMDLLKQSDGNVKVLPPIYTMPDKVEVVMDFIAQMCTKAAENNELFRIYKLNTLFFHMLNAVKIDDHHAGFPKESLALTHLKTDKFKYTVGVTCELHEDSEKNVECTLSRVHRWAYSMMDMSCSHAGLEPVPGKHIPGNFDVDAINELKKQRRDQLDTASSLNSSMVDSFSDSFNLSNVVLSEKKKKEKRTNTPLRMPKADYSQQIQVAPALSEFTPPLAIGRGRGRPMK